VPHDTARTTKGVKCEEGHTHHNNPPGESRLDQTEAAVGPGGSTAGESYGQSVYPHIRPFGLMGRLDTQSVGFSVYNEETYVCPEAGEMLLGPNDTVLSDNRGEFTATVTLTPKG
jgi:hypothetical protein